MTTTLLIRPRGTFQRFIAASGAVYIETSVEELATRSWITEDIENAQLGSVILEDLHEHDLEDDLRVSLIKGSRGQSCPWVTRWSVP